MPSRKARAQSTSAASGCYRDRAGPRSGPRYGTRHRRQARRDRLSHPRPHPEVPTQWASKEGSRCRGDPWSPPSRLPQAAHLRMRVRMGRDRPGMDRSVVSHGPAWATARPAPDHDGTDRHAIEVEVKRHDRRGRPARPRPPPPLHRGARGRIGPGAGSRSRPGDFDEAGIEALRDPRRGAGGQPLGHRHDHHAAMAAGEEAACATGRPVARVAGRSRPPQQRVVGDPGRQARHRMPSGRRPRRRSSQASRTGPGRARSTTPVPRGRARRGRRPRRPGSRPAPRPRPVRHSPENLGQRPGDPRLGPGLVEGVAAQAVAQAARGDRAQVVEGHVSAPSRLAWARAVRISVSSPRKAVGAERKAEAGRRLQHRIRHGHVGELRPRRQDRLPQRASSAAHSAAKAAGSRS